MTQLTDFRLRHHSAAALPAVAMVGWQMMSQVDRPNQILPRSHLDLTQIQPGSHSDPAWILPLVPPGSHSDPIRIQLGSHLNPTRIPEQVTYARRISRSLYCPLTCGDTATSRRTFDAVVAGCLSWLPTHRPLSPPCLHYLSTLSPLSLHSIVPSLLTANGCPLATHLQVRPDLCWNQTLGQVLLDQPTRYATLGQVILDQPTRYATLGQVIRQAHSAPS